MNWRRAVALLLAVTMPVTCSASAVETGTTSSIPTSSISTSSDSPVTVVSNGKIVTDPTIVAAAAKTYTAAKTTVVANPNDASADSVAGSADASSAGDAKSDVSGSSDDGSSAGSTNADTANTEASDSQTTDSQTTPRAASTPLGGRDFTGQVTKTINGKAYILIGNEQQLRAIGSDKKVIKPIWKIETEEYQQDACTRTTLLGKVETYDCWVDIPDVKTQTYAGDADLAADATLRNAKADGDSNGSLFPKVGDRKYHYVTLDDNGAEVSASKADTGLTYTADRNYIIFRDIDLSTNAANPANTNWTPLMFSTIMLGVKSQTPATVSSLWNGVNTDGDAVTDQADRPTIANVKVRQTGKINQQQQSGIGFFATISNQVSLDSNSSGLKSLGETVVSNIRLEHVDVSNASTETEDTVTLVSGLMTVLGALVYVIGGLLDAITLIIGINLDLRDLLKNLLDIRAKDPSIFATGGFAGRVDGEVTVSKCEVADVTVSNVKDMTGGFVGYSTGETQYDVLSNALGSIISVLSYILNLVPGLGLGDLVTWLLNSKILNVHDLLPVGYYNPTFTGDSVSGFQKGTVIGSADKDYAGGFVGNQIGTIIENSTVTSTTPYTVQARYYAGGFSGVMRNGVMQGAISDLGVQLPKIVAAPQSLVEESSVTADVTVKGGSFAGGFAGAMANSFAVNDSVNGTIDVTASGVTRVSGTGTDAKEITEARAGGFAGVATIGWVSDLGSEDASSSNLLSTVSKLLVKALSGKEEGTATLLSLVGIDPSAILGVRMGGAITVHSDNDYAGGIIGRGDGALIAASDTQHLNKFSFWKHGRTTPAARDNTVNGLKSVTAQGDYAGGIAGQLGTASIGGVINDTVGLGGFLPFEVSAVTVNGAADGYTVNATGDYASAGIGKATGGYIGKATTAYQVKDSSGKVTSNPVPDTAGVTLNGVQSVDANNYAGGFLGAAGPGDLVGGDGLDLLGLGLLKVKGLLSVAEGVMVSAEAVNVNGIDSGMIVAANGKHKDGDVTQYVAGGFVGQSNSTQITDAHVRNLHMVVADETYGNAGGFVGLSETGGLADVADDSSILELVKVDGLVKAVGYLIPTYTNVDVYYINGGSVSANIAGGFAGDFQSGKVDDSGKIAADGKTSDPWAVINVDTVTGGSYAGGFGGRVHSGALAEAGKGLSVLGGLGDKLQALNLSIDVTQLAQVAAAYVPYITAAGVRSDADTVEKTSGRDISDADDPGLKVSATRLASNDSNSGAAGGFIGYGSGVQVSKSDVTQLRHTDVKAPKNLETTKSIDDTYLDAKKSTYAVTGARYAGGYIGKMDIGSAASVGGGLSVLGQSIKLDDVLSVLSVVVSTIEHSEVTGGIGGYAVLSSTASHKTDGGDDDPLGMAGGFAGYIKGGHIQDSNSHEFAYIIGQVSAGGYVGTMEPGAVADVLGDGSVLTKLINMDNLLSLVQDFVPTIRNSSTDAVICGGAVRAQAASDGTTRRGMAGGYAGHNRGGHIWGKSTAAWKSENYTEGEHKGQYSGTLKTAYASRIRSVYGQELSGGYTGFMEAADTADGGSLSLLDKIITVDNIANVLSVVYPTEKHTKVTGPLRNMSYKQWETWVDNIGKYGAYGKEFTAVVKAGSAKNETDGSANAGNGSDTNGTDANGTAQSGTTESGTTESDAAQSGTTESKDGSDESGTADADGNTADNGDDKTASSDNGTEESVADADTGNDADASADEKSTAKVHDQESLDKFLEDYIFGFNVVAGRSGYVSGVNLRDSGVAGGHVGLMSTGVITDGQSMDVRNVTAMRAAGGYAGAMQSGTAAKFGTITLLGSDKFKLNLGQMLGVAQVFVPVVKASSVIGYRKGLRVTSTGDDKTGDENVKHGTGNAGGFVALAVGAQIWGDLDENGEKPAQDAAAAGVNVTNLRKVSGTNNVGGFVGLATSGSVADIDTGATDGFLNKVLDQVIGTPANLLKVLQATVVTIRGAHVSADDEAWGFTVDGAYKLTVKNDQTDTSDAADADGDTATDAEGATTQQHYAINVGGFAGSLQAAILGDKDSAKGTGTAVDTANDPAALTVDNLRAVNGGQYVGGFFGLADVSSVASVGGGTAGTGDGSDSGSNDVNILLKLVKLGRVGVLDAFRTFIYDGQVHGVADGIQVKAHVSSTSGILESTRFTGAAGGFGGGLINGSVKKSGVTNLNSVNGLNYVGGFIGHLGKSGTVSANKVEAADSKLAGLTAGVLDIWGSHVEDSTVSGINAGFTVAASHNGDDYGANESLTDAKHRKGEEIAAGFAGYADLSRISDCKVTNFKKASSGELAGGFAGQTTKAYLVDGGVNSTLVNLLIEYVVNPLLDILYVDKIEHIGDKLNDWKEQKFGWLTKFIDLELFTEGNALYVNLLGLKIGVALDKHGTENDDTDDTAYIFIGDSKIEVGCSKKGVDENSVDNVKVELIKANRTKIARSSVQGIADGYDVFGGGATQDSDGEAEDDPMKTGYAGGFVAVNDEGLLEGNDMTYADTIRGTAGLVGPFSGKTNLESVYDFNTVRGIEGNGNTYHIYRDVPWQWSYALTAKGEQITYGSHMDDGTGDTGSEGTSGVLKLPLNRYDVAHMAEKTVIPKFESYKDAVMANNLSGKDDGEDGANRAKSLGVYVSAAKAVLMLDTEVADNNGGITPEPDDGQDPCGLDGCRAVDLTIRKVWKNDKPADRPKSITVRITATYTDKDGKTVTPESIECPDDDCTTDEPSFTKQGNPWNVTLDASDASVEGGSTWRKKVKNLPVALIEKSDDGTETVRYYTYTVKEIAVTYPGDTPVRDYDKTPTDAGYHVYVTYNAKVYVATITNAVETMPNTGGSGTTTAMLLAVLLLLLGAAWYVRESRTESTSGGGIGDGLPFGNGLPFADGAPPVGLRGRHIGR